ncbi:hypothetical protein AB1Y20_014145 [Prymnesium parvum]|uniref:Uncharacterized protein n=1 Tax=Prymnesium parvum TaxID=97485 RepID=A0AB34IG03_PRYPA
MPDSSPGVDELSDALRMSSFESPADRADAEVVSLDSLLDRVHALVPLMSPQAITRTTRKLRQLKRDCVDVWSGYS